MSKYESKNMIKYTLSQQVVLLIECPETPFHTFTTLAGDVTRMCQVLSPGAGHRCRCGDPADNRTGESLLPRSLAVQQGKMTGKATVTD